MSETLSIDVASPSEHSSKKEKKQQQQQNQQQGQKQKQQQGQQQQQQQQQQGQQQQSNDKAATEKKTASESNNTLANQVFRMALFDHLPRKQTQRDPDLVEEDKLIHPATINLGLLYQKGTIQSDDDRAHALILVLIAILEDYKTPPKRVLREDLDKYISKQVQYLVDSRPISKGMGNIIRYFRQIISKTPMDLNEYDAKQLLLKQLRSFLEEKMLYSVDSIAHYVGSSVNNGDVLLTFGSSPLLRKVLLKVAESKEFELVVVDTRPLCEGLLTLSALSPKVRCTYSPLSGIALALQSVKKVILGASCLLSNGSMLAPAGTAMVASVAAAMQIPVMVACESYKFSDKVQLDPIVFNELGHTSEIAVAVTAAEAAQLTGSETVSSQEFVAVPQTNNKYRGSADKSSLLYQSINNDGPENLLLFPRRPGLTGHSKLPFQVVNLRYDVTPINNISVVATETGLIPPSSVPVLIREIQSDQQDM